MKILIDFIKRTSYIRSGDYQVVHNVKNTTIMCIVFKLRGSPLYADNLSSIVGEVEIGL